MNHNPMANCQVPRSGRRTTQTVLATFCVMLLILFSGRLFAQAGIDTGSVTGTVTDPTGALIPGAQLTLTNVNTGIVQKTVSTSSGSYAFPLVRVGTYTLKTEAKGFETSLITGIGLHLGNNVTQDISLKVGSAATEITVTSSAPLLQAQDSSLGLSVGSGLANELPLIGGAQGRGVLSLIILAPGSQPANSQIVNGVQSGAIDVRVNGANNNSEVFGGQILPLIPDSVEEFKVQSGNNPADVGHSYGTTVNMMTKQGTNAFHGRLWEYNENDITSANEYFRKRNQILNKPLPQANRPNRLRENSFGAVVSGPVWIPKVYDGHNRTFFTGAFQYTYFSATGAYTNTIPTTAMQSSGFTNLSDQLSMTTNTKLDGLNRKFQQGTMLDPATTRAVLCGKPDPSTGLTADCNTVGSGEQGIVTNPTSNLTGTYAIVRDPFVGTGASCPSLVGTTNWASAFVPTGGTAAGPVPTACLNQIPSNRLDPNAVALLKLFPTPNQTNANGSYSSNYTTYTKRTVVSKGYSARVDHTFSEKDSAFLTFDHYNAIDQTSPPYPGELEGGGNVSFWTTQPAYVVVLTENHVFSPTLVNQFRISKGQQYNTRLDPNGINTTYNLPTKYGIQGIPQTSYNGGLPVFGISNLAAFGSRVNSTWQKTGSWQTSDQVTKTIGRHEWKFGGEYTWTFGNIDQNANSRGSFNYNGVYSNVPYSGDGQTAMADFLVTPIAASTSYLAAGGLSTATNMIGGLNGYNGNSRVKSTYHAPYIAAYAVDTWKITPDLTANLGLRYEYFGPYASVGGQEANFWMGGDGNQPGNSAYYVGHEGCASTMSPSFKALLAYDNIPIICEPGDSVNHMKKLNLAPRLGLAYRVRPNLVVRSGMGFAYGAFNSVGYGGTLGTNYPFRFNIQNGSAQNAYTPQLIGPSATTTATMESTFGNIDMTNAAAAYLPLGSLALYGKPYHFKIPYEINLNMAVQYQFTNHDSVEVRYVGNLGRQLESANPYHNAARELLKPGQTLVTLAKPTDANPYKATSIDSTIPFPNLAVNAGPMENTGMISAYHSGQAEYKHQFAMGFTMNASYEFDSCLSDGQGGQQNAAGPGNGRAPWVKGFGGYRADYDRCANISSQIFRTYGEFALPFGKGAQWAGNVNQLVDYAIGGWKLNPIFYATSGNYLNVGCGGTVGGVKGNAGFTGPWFQTNAAWGCNAPAVPGADKYKPGSGDLARTRTTGYFNSAAFTAPTQAVQTNGQQDFSPLGVRGNQIIGPGWYDFNLSTHKQFLIHESMNVEVVAEAFNVFNHAEMGNPGTGGYANPNESISGGYGVITGTRNGPRTWEFAAKFNF